MDIHAKICGYDGYGYG